MVFELVTKPGMAGVSRSRRWKALGLTGPPFCNASSRRSWWVAGFLLAVFNLLETTDTALPQALTVTLEQPRVQQSSLFSNV